MDRSCPECSHGNVIKYGTRINKKKTNVPGVQRYYCKSCKKAFEEALGVLDLPRKWGQNIRRAIVTPDKHFPYEDKPAINALVKAIELVKPSIYVDLGDTGEWESVSMWKWKKKKRPPLEYMIPDIEKEIEASRYNKVNIDHLKEQVDNINKQIEKLRNGNH